MAKLVSSGFWQSEAKLRIHVSFATDTAWIFSVKAVKELIRSDLSIPRYTKPTSSGFLVPIDSIETRRIALTGAMLEHAPHDAASESVKGGRAETVARMILTGCTSATKKEDIAGVDFWWHGRGVQVKHDYGAGYTGNFCIETKERNARGLYSSGAHSGGGL